MGLDWRPTNKPKPGFENEFENLFYIIGGKRKQEIGLKDRLKGIKPKTQEQLLERFIEVSIPSYITLNAPRVGIDKNATEWAESKFENRIDKKQTFDEFMTSMKGYYVVDLVHEHDGIPKYIAMHDEKHVFRGQFLNLCEDIIGNDLLEEAYISKLAIDALDYGNKLMKIAIDYSKKNNCEYLRDQRMPPDCDEGNPESLAHILFSASKWLFWWGERGHGLEADF